MLTGSVVKTSMIFFNENQLISKPCAFSCCANCRRVPKHVQLAEMNKKFKSAETNCSEIVLRNKIFVVN